MDSEVDRLRSGLIVRAREVATTTAVPLALALVGRYFERLADHGVAFAVHATFVVTGERVEVGP
jgi:phosphate uptake regulator